MIERDWRQMSLGITQPQRRAINTYRLARGGKLSKADAMRELLELGLRQAGIEIDQEDY